MISQDVIDQFTEPSDRFIPAMVVTVTGSRHRSYLVPSGFQLDLYVNSLFPSFDLKIETYSEKMVVSVMHNNKAIETHEGVFIKRHESH